MAVLDSQQVAFREMSLADLEDVIRIESRAYSFPWSRGIFSDCLTAGHDCRLICVDGVIVGHAVLSAAAGEAHLLNVCIQRDRQGTGLGRQFVHHLVDRASILGAEMLFLEVRPTNKIALILYESLGFLQVGVRKDYYPGEPGREDALVLALRLPKPESPKPD